MFDPEKLKSDESLSIREKMERLEHGILSSSASKSDQSRGREKPERECHVRPAFQHDRDRIIHCKAFRRLKHKTQVFLAPRGDHYRTRLTHTIEVSQIARTISKALYLNEELTEAIALGHDLGHTPFGHAGEFALQEVVEDGFNHWEQSLRVVDRLAMGGRGLNLTWEVRDGILKHSKGRDYAIVGDEASDFPSTMEGKVVRAADVVAYTTHDLQDAIESGLITTTDVPKECLKVLGETTSQRINTMVSDLIYETAGAGKSYLMMSPPVLEGLEKLRAFLFETVYFSEPVQAEFKKSRHVIHQLYHYYMDNPEVLLSHTGKSELGYGLSREVTDFIAGMSDSYALHIWDELFRPKPWSW
ncbi:MAG: deoxyguanosinetriphosphate triphosphohydrolase [bacterium]